MLRTSALLHGDYAAQGMNVKNVKTIGYNEIYSYICSVIKKDITMDEKELTLTNEEKELTLTLTNEEIRVLNEAMLDAYGTYSYEAAKAISMAESMEYKLKARKIKEIFLKLPMG